MTFPFPYMYLPTFNMFVLDNVLTLFCALILLDGMETKGSLYSYI